MKCVFLLAALTIVVALPALAAAGQSVLWVEAEQFDETGGWSNDSQFVDLMGSPYLLATGVGKPVADAVARVKVARAGSYRLWVRCKDWLPKHSPGRFQVLVGGQASKVTFGQAKTDAWQWVDGGEFELDAGKVEVRLHDLTGWWGRCCAVVLAGGGFRPADDAQALAAQRQAHLGVSAEVADKGPYDVVVVGGGLSGCAAAIAAARHGCSVALIQDRPVLGGNASSEIQVPVSGDVSGERFDPRETGIIEELSPVYRDTGRSKEIERIVRAEKNIDLHLNTRATGAERAGKDRIAAVRALHVRTGQRLRFGAPLFIDCTGHGWVGYWAGAEFRQGREARAEFGESLAPEQADRHTMGNSLYAAGFRTHDKPVGFTAPAWAYKWTKPSDFEDPASHRRPSGVVRPESYDPPVRGKGRRPRDPNGATHRVWWVEYGGMVDTVKDAEAIRDELFRINVGLWDYAKNYDPKHRKANANRELVWLNYVPGTRESRRLIGDYIMTQHDYTDQIVHPDTVAYTGWGIDVHHPQGFWVRGVDCIHVLRIKTSIPFRSLYSKNVSNLLMAGRCHSATHIAMGATRIMRSCALMGQAAGTAAAIIKKEKCTPRGVYQRHIERLQQMLLKDGCYLMGVANRDPADLARKAKATASSARSYYQPDEREPHGGTIHSVDVDRAVMFPAPAGRIEAVAFYLRSDAAKPLKVKAVLRRAKAFGNFAGTDNLAEAVAAVPPNSRGWVTFDLAAKIEKGRHYFAVISATKGLKWELYPWFPKNHCRAYRKDGGWTRMPACYKVRLTPGGEPPVPPASGRTVELAADNAVNGWNRAVAGERNAWVPDPKQQPPHWLQLAWDKPVAVNTVHVSFQRLRERASDFRIDCSAGETWRTAAAVTDNTERRRVIRFDPVTTDKLRLVVTRAPNEVAVCELRVYNEPAP